jgi:1-acyl-sn-glycerol-3-phosphate acyltransferase
VTKLVGFIRALCYYAGFYPVTIVWASLCIIVARALPFKQRFYFVTAINNFYIFWLRVCCGVKVNVQGRENLPSSGAYVVISNHQSEWETIYFQLLIQPQVVVLKQELLKIPFFGWALALLEPIALDRSKRRGALKQLLDQGKAKLSAGVPILIFPQGTRLPVGELGRWNKGGAMLAVSSEVPLVAIAHNAGRFWPGKGFIKNPGTVDVLISKPIETIERTVEEVHKDSVDWLEDNLKNIKA